jgi:hypothetical protein
MREERLGFSFLTFTAQELYTERFGVSAGDNRLIRVRNPGYFLLTAAM